MRGNHGYRARIISKRDPYIYKKLSTRKLRKYDGHQCWEDLYFSFNNKDIDDEKVGLLLTSYLASWGMFRGSPFLPKFLHHIQVDLVDILRTADLINIDLYTALIKEHYESTVPVKDKKANTPSGKYE